MSDPAAERAVQDVALVVGGRWHAPEMAEGLAAIGVNVHFVDPVSLRSVYPVRAWLVSMLLRASGRVRALTALGCAAFGRLAERRVRALDPDGIIVWSGFGTETLRSVRSPSILVRGSNHIETQRLILDALPSSASPPRAATVRRETREYALCGAITVPTEHIAADPRWGNADVVVAPYGIAPARDDALAVRPGSAVRLVFVGEIGLRKGADLLRLLDDVPEVEALVMVGKTRGAVTLPQKALLRGQLASSDVRTEMMNAHAFILLSREEGMARSGLEAMTLGLPLIVTEQSGLADWARQGAGVVVPTEPTPEDLRLAIREVIERWLDFSSGCVRLSRTWSWTDRVNLLIAELERQHIRAGDPEEGVSR